MPKNKIKQFRTQLKLTQRELAERAGTSQQQIQRVEAGTISTSLATARAICSALGKPFEAVFPEAAKALVAYQREREQTGYIDPEELEKASNAGIEADQRDWYLELRLRGLDDARVHRISPATYRRLYTLVQDESDSGMALIVFDTLTHRVALNLAEVVSCQFMFERQGTPEMQASEDDYTVLIFPVGGGKPIEFTVDPDSPEDGDDGVGQLGHIFFMAELAIDAGDRYRIVDEDGEHAFIRAGSIASFEAPLHLIRDGGEGDEHGGEE